MLSYKSSQTSAWPQNLSQNNFWAAKLSREFLMLFFFSFITYWRNYLHGTGLSENIIKLPVSCLELLKMSYEIVQRQNFKRNARNMHFQS